MNKRQITVALLHDYAAYLHAQERSASTIEKYLRDVRAFAHWLGGQPVDGTDREKAADRGKVLFRLDQNAPLRFSHENPAVQALYREYLDEPCSHRAEELLHCDHFAWQMNAAR